MKKVIKNKESLIYDLIFSEKDLFNIDIAEYIEDIYNYQNFITDIKAVLKKSKVKIVDSNLVLDSKTAIWTIKVNK